MSDAVYIVNNMEVKLTPGNPINSKELCEGCIFNSNATCLAEFPKNPATGFIAQDCLRTFTVNGKKHSAIYVKAK